MFGFKTKKLDVPISNETREVTAIELWEVAWTAVSDRFGGDFRHAEKVHKHEVFTNEKDAKDFGDALQAAHKLIGNAQYSAIVRVFKRG